MSKKEIVMALQDECDGQAFLSELVKAYKKKHYPTEIYGENYVDDYDIKTNLNKFTRSLKRDGIIKTEWRMIRKLKGYRKRILYIQVKTIIANDIAKIIDGFCGFV